MYNQKKEIWQEGSSQFDENISMGLETMVGPFELCPSPWIQSSIEARSHREKGRIILVILSQCVHPRFSQNGPSVPSPPTPPQPTNSPKAKISSTISTSQNPSNSIRSQTSPLATLTTSDSCKLLILSADFFFYFFFFNYNDQLNQSEENF